MLKILLLLTVGFSAFANAAEVATLHCMTVVRAAGTKDQMMDDLSISVQVDNPGISPNELKLLNGGISVTTIQDKIQIEEVPWSPNAISFMSPAIVRETEPKDADYRIDILNIKDLRFGQLRNSQAAIIQASIFCNLLRPTP